MPALPSPGQVFKTIYKYHADDCIAENINYFSYDGASGISAADLASFFGAVATDWNAPYVGAASTNTNGDDVQLIDLSSSTGAEDTEVNTWTGTNTGGTLPGSVAVCVSDVISRRYRGGHPRNYMMVGLGNDFESSSMKFWQAGFLTNIQNGWNSFMALFPVTIGAHIIRPVNVSYYETVAGVKTVRPTPLVDVIHEKIARDRVCTQRRRLGRIGG